MEAAKYSQTNMKMKQIPELDQSGSMTREREETMDKFSCGSWHQPEQPTPTKNNKRPETTPSALKATESARRAMSPSTVLL